MLTESGNRSVHLLVETPFAYEPVRLLPVTRFLMDTIHGRMAMVLGGALFVCSLMLALVLGAGLVFAGESSADGSKGEFAELDFADGDVGAAGGQSTFGESLRADSLSPVFAPSVMYWESRILSWSDQYGVDPNLAAIIMQIESCGDPEAISGAGAQGLFQVMPFHFAAGEDSLDPDTNAMRGLSYFADRLAQTGGDIGRAFAGYNGGHVAAGGSWDSWPSETQRYYVWSTGIYEDIGAGLTDSPTLQKWMAAGGASLCLQASARLGL